MDTMNRMLEHLMVNNRLTLFQHQKDAIIKAITLTEEKPGPLRMCVYLPTGKGKTTFVSFLAAQAMRIPNLRTFFFDRHYGLKVFTECVGGKYVTFDGNTAATMNPLHLDDSPDLNVY